MHIATRKTIIPLLSLLLVMSLSVPAAPSALAQTDVYSFRMNLSVPQVVDNSTSRGRRVYRRQRLEGTLTVTYHQDAPPEVAISGLKNRNYKVAGNPVAYRTTVDEYVTWHLVGSNATGVFRKPSVCFGMEAQPSYVYAYEPTNDNSLVLTLSGKGRSRRHITGHVAGTLGCGCSDYGHKSPTRVMGPYGRPLDIVVDVAGVSGTWKATLQSSTP